MTDTQKPAGYCPACEKNHPAGWACPKHLEALDNENTDLRLMKESWNLLRIIRARGWSVAIHNDYRLNGVFMTFWLFTKEGSCLKGEGSEDWEALNQVLSKILLL